MTSDIKNNLNNSKFFLFYLKIIVCFFFVFILMIVSINYKMDPGKVYSEHFKSTSTENMSLIGFINKLVLSDNGIIMKSDIWNDYLIILFNANSF